MKRFLCLLLSLLAFASPALASDVGYEVFVASFADGDGDGVGDLRGLTDSLDYIGSLGATVLWLMPIAPSPTYHKYDVADYCAVDPAYGTLEDFEAFAAACHARGMRVLLDLVLNHSSSRHPWFVSACDTLASCSDWEAALAQNPYVDYYHFSRENIGYAVPNAEGWYYEAVFDSGMPDLNTDSPAVRAEFEAILRFWLSHGADGFRLDATTHYVEGSVNANVAFLRWLRQTATRIRPDVLLIGEAWTDANTLTKMYAAEIELFNFAFGTPDGWIVKAVQSGKGAAFAERLASWNAALRSASPSTVDVPFVGNHDTARVAGVFRRDQRKLKQIATLTLLSPGLPFIYYGDELGMTGSGRDENKRLPMLWGMNGGCCLPPANADQEQRCEAGVAEQENDPASLLNFYRAVTALRAQCPALADGRVTWIDAGSEAVAAYQCDDAKQSAQVWHNLGAEAVTLPVPEGYALLGGLDAGDGAPTLADGRLTLPPSASCVLAR